MELRDFGNSMEVPKMVSYLLLNVRDIISYSVWQVDVNDFVPTRCRTRLVRR